MLAVVTQAAPIAVLASVPTVTPQRLLGVVLPGERPEDALVVALVAFLRGRNMANGGQRRVEVEVGNVTRRRVAELLGLDRNAVNSAAKRVGLLEDGDGLDIAPDMLVTRWQDPRAVRFLGLEHDRDVGARAQLLVGVVRAQLNERTPWCAPRLARLLGWTEDQVHRAMLIAKRARLLGRMRDGTGRWWTVANAAAIERAAEQHARRIAPPRTDSAAPVAGIRPPRGRKSPTSWQENAGPWQEIAHLPKESGETGETGSSAPSAAPAVLAMPPRPAALRADDPIVPKPEPRKPEPRTDSAADERAQLWQLKEHEERARARLKDWNTYNQALTEAARAAHEAEDQVHAWVLVLTRLGVLVSRFKVGDSAMRTKRLEVAQLLAGRGVHASTAAEWALRFTRRVANSGRKPWIVPASLAKAIAEKPAGWSKDKRAPVAAGVDGLLILAPAHCRQMHEQLLTIEQRRAIADWREQLAELVAPVVAKLTGQGDVAAERARRAAFDERVILDRLAAAARANERHEVERLIVHADRLGIARARIESAVGVTRHRIAVTATA